MTYLWLFLDFLRVFCYITFVDFSILGFYQIINLVPKTLFNVLKTTSNSGTNPKRIQSNACRQYLLPLEADFFHEGFFGEYFIILYDENMKFDF